MCSLRLCLVHMMYNSINVVIALVCGVITGFLMVLALASSDWLLASGWRQGLFEHCVEPGAKKPLPFQINAESGCHPARDEAYITASAALCVICLMLDVLATILTGLGLSNNDPTCKTRYYRIAVWVMTLARAAVQQPHALGVRVGVRRRVGLGHLPVRCGGPAAV